jgi:hypothetical protein
MGLGLGFQFPYQADDVVASYSSLRLVLAFNPFRSLYEVLLVEDVVVEVVDDFVEVVELVVEEVVLAEWLTRAVYMQEQAHSILDGIACHDDAHFGTVIDGT